MTIFSRNFNIHYNGYERTKVITVVDVGT